MPKTNTHRTTANMKCDVPLATISNLSNAPNLSQHDKRLRIGNIVRHGRPEDDPRKDLPHQTRHLEHPLGDGTHHVDERKEDYGRVQVGEFDVDAELGVMFVISAQRVICYVAGSVDFGLGGQEARIRTRTAVRVIIIGTEERTASEAEAAEHVGDRVPEERLGFERHVLLVVDWKC